MIHKISSFQIFKYKIFIVSHLQPMQKHKRNLPMMNAGRK